MKATINGRELAWDETGSGRTILFLHGFPFNRQLWYNQMQAVPKGWRGVAMDLRGFGESAGSDDPQYTMDMFADDAAALLTHLRVRRAVICGLSMGGYIALAMQRRYPSMVGGLILADTRATADGEQEKQNRLQLAQRVQAEGNGVVVDSMMQKLFAPVTPYTKPKVAEFVRGMMSAARPESIARALLGMAVRPNSEPDLRNISVPTLVIVGAEDQITDRGQAQLMARAIRGSQIEVIPEAGHVSNLEAPEIFNEAVRRLLASF